MWLLSLLSACTSSVPPPDPDPVETMPGCRVETPVDVVRVDRGGDIAAVRLAAGPVGDQVTTVGPDAALRLFVDGASAALVPASVDTEVRWSVAGDQLLAFRPDVHGQIILRSVDGLRELHAIDLESEFGVGGALADVQADAEGGWWVTGNGPEGGRLWHLDATLEIRATWPGADPYLGRLGAIAVGNGRLGVAAEDGVAGDRVLVLRNDFVPLRIVQMREAEDAGEVVDGRLRWVGQGLLLGTRDGRVAFDRPGTRQLERLDAEGGVHAWAASTQVMLAAGRGSTAQAWGVSAMGLEPGLSLGPPDARGLDVRGDRVAIASTQTVAFGTNADFPLRECELPGTWLAGPVVTASGVVRVVGMPANDAEDDSQDAVVLWGYR